MYFTVSFPFVMIAIFLVKGLTLDGAIEGLEYYLIPRFEDLKSLVLWRRAGEQIFYSLGIGCGTLAMSGSHTRFRQGIAR